MASGGKAASAVEATVLESLEEDHNPEDASQHWGLLPCRHCC